MPCRTNPPSPGSWNTRSITTAPPKIAPISIAPTVMNGIAATRIATSKYRTWRCTTATTCQHVIAGERVREARPENTHEKPPRHQAQRGRGQDHQLDISEWVANECDVATRRQPVKLDG